jgi:uncharacterized protein
MPTIDRHAPGTFCWLDLAAHDAEGAKRFYGALFGWEPDDRRYGEGEDDVYTMYRLHGRDVAASYAMDAHQRATGTPPSWLMYVAVAGLEAAAARALHLGGVILAEPFDVMEVGRMALVQDPTGAMLALWEPKQHPGTGIRDEPGAHCWTELATPDPDRARDFYTALFGWTAREDDYGIPYTTFLTRDGAQVGGMFRITPEMEGMPTLWMPYFAVDGTDAAAARAAELGGETLLPPADIPSVGRFALLRDSQGALFNILTFSQG